MRFLLPVALLFTALPSTAARWTIEDVLMLERASSVTLSRDGAKVVWRKTKMNRKKGASVSHLYLHSFSGGYTVQLTRGTDSASAPEFSPDGTRVVFLSSRSDKTAESGGSEGKKNDQVWIIDLRGGEPYKVTDFKKGVKEVHWLDNDTLLLTATEDPSLYELQNKERKDTSKVVDDEEHAPPVRLYRFSLKTRRPERLTTNKDRITDTFVSWNGRWVVTIHERSLRYEYDQEIRPATWLRDLKTGAATQLFPDGKILPRQVRFTPDDKGFYFIAPYTTHPKYIFAEIAKLYYYDLGTRRHTAVNLDWERGLGSDYAVVPGGVVALLADGVRYKAALYTKKGDSWTRQWLEGKHVSNIFGLEASPDGKRIVYDYSTGSKPDQWYGARLAGAVLVDAKQFTKLNEYLAGKPFAKAEAVRWKGARDEEVEGMLYYPHNYEPGKRYPLVLMIHGGPHGVDLDRFSDRFSNPIQLLAQRGAFVLKPNYHGSSNYGLEWGESISGGNYNELEWIDCDRGVDAMIERGLADPEKLGVMGWSNGSIITIEITTRTTRYKAASAGAGDVNWISDWANCQFGHSFDDYYLGTTPLADPEFYMKKSPLFRMDKVVTPTIIFFGDKDRQVPTEQGWQHYRALQHLGKTDVKFILFPGEAHGPRKYGHQHRKLAEELAWFDKYLFGNADRPNEALKPSSPLAAALKLAGAGDIPETVDRGKIAVGRFEVTRAQFAAFKPGYSYPEGTGRYPANGVSFEDAKAYCRWLSEKTGRKFRLPTEKEFRKLLNSSAKENTLDAWAGYPVNADDAARLAPLVKRLGPEVLLRPVGSYPGRGLDPLYDLGGNVAEWVTAEDGSGKALGGSADRPADPKFTGAPDPDFVGFRVVEEF